VRIRGAFLVIVTLALACAGFAAAGFVWTTLAQVRSDLSGSRATMSLESGPQASLIYDRDDKLTYSLFTEQRIDVPLAQVSPVMVQAVLAAEDHRFYDHFGLDPVRMAGAAAANLKARRIVEGGSTITQQLARNLELGKQRTWSRKFREVILAAEIEARHSKDTILETYLNTAYFGEGYYGVEAASRGYFGKPASGLAPDEAALLAGLIRAPSANSPNKTPDGATTVRNTVLRAMRDQGVMTDEDMRRYVAAPLTVKPRRSNGLTEHAHTAETACGLYYFEEVRKQLVEMFGEDQVLEGGLRVFTSYDARAQHAAEQSIARRLGQLAPSTRIRSAGADGVQGALVAMEPGTGHVIALVGGRDFHESSFNRATQAHRQPGSAFKPFVWAAAVERGWAPGTMLTGLDTPIGDGTWMPSGDHEAGSYTLRRALTVSSNRAAAQLMQQVGLSSTIHTARRLGIESDLPAVPSLALGTGEVTLLEMVAAYGALANEGVWTRPTLITRVEDASGAVIYAAPFDQRRAVSTGTAYLMNSMMSDVVNRGTGWRARQAGFTLPAAGKTGTSDDYADAWFVGYTPGVVAGVWFGHDRRKTIMKSYASDIAVPAWAAFMREATRGDEPVWYEMPSDVEKVEICRASGHRAGDACRRSPGYARVMLLDGSMVDRAVEGGVTTELFTLGSAPYGECPLHSGLYLDASYELAPMPELSDLSSDLSMPAMPRGMSETHPSGSLTSDDLGSPLFKASEAVGTSGVTPAPRTAPAPMPTALPSIPASPTEPAASKPALGTIPKAGTPVAPALPGTPVRKPGGGIRIESVVKPDGTMVTVIRGQR